MTQDREIDLSVEVVGTPDEVWAALATGQGVSAWLQPTVIEECAGGAFSYDMGGGAVNGIVTAWEPPRRFGQRTTWDAGTDSATVATEWTIESGDDGTCVVRMVMTGFGESDDWDDEVEGMAAGMQAALHGLRDYLQRRSVGLTIEQATRPEAAIASALAARTSAFGKKDAAGLCAFYTEDVVQFSLAPPLVQPPGVDENALGAWLAGFQGPLSRRALQVSITVSDLLAVAHALVNVQGQRAGGGRGSWWMRETLVLRHSGGRWLISHEHQSAPSAMDGSERTEFDLSPE